MLVLNAVLCCVVLCCVVLCCVVLCCVVLCCVVLCCVAMECCVGMLCCVVLCCVAMECYVMFSELYVNWKANSWVFLSYEQKYSTLNVVLYMKLNLLKNAIWCRNFKTLAKREIFKNYKNNCR